VSPVRGNTYKILVCHFFGDEKNGFKGKMKKNSIYRCFFEHNNEVMPN